MAAEHIETAAERYAREWGSHTASPDQRPGGGAGGDNRKTRGLDGRGGTYVTASNNTGEAAALSTTGTKNRKNTLFVDENGNTAVS